MVDSQILAMGGGGFSMEPDNPLLDDYLLSLAPAGRKPRICFVPTASGDSEGYSERFLAAFGPERAEATVLTLFSRTVTDLDAFVLEQDIIYVGGGNTANLLAVWRVHRVDEVLRECWESGVVLGGVSAGSICWYVGGPTDSYGTELRLSPPGLGFLPYGNGVHYDSEEQRRPLLHGLVEKGDLPTSHATDDGVGLVYDGTELVEAVADRPDVGAYVIERQPDGTVIETRIEPRLLG
jgi:peptidase E